MPTNVRNLSDEVFPGILVGDKLAASNRYYLSKLGVTHVLNAAEGHNNRKGYVDTTKDYYEPYGITYMGLQLLDVPQTNISIHFNDVADFIDLALDAGGKVLVNCEMGMSRSSTCVLAYLMLRHHMSADEALSMVRKHRFVRPNRGFLRQLDELDNQLKSQQSSVSILKSQA